MPPANSPAEAGSPADRSRPGTPASFRSVLRELASPVPDYASTLTIQSEEDDIDADNISFLRAPFATGEADPAEAAAPPRESREASPHRRLLLQERARAHARGEPWPEPQLTTRGVRRVRHTPSGDTHELWAERRRHEVWAERMSQHGAAPYGDRIPNQQSLYDWAPATEEGEEEELEAILSELRRQQPNTHPEILRVLARADLEASRDPRNRVSSPRSPAGAQQEPSLRSAAILQSVRRNWRFSTRSRMLMSRYIMERERSAQDHERSLGQTHPDSTGAGNVSSELESSLTDLQRIERVAREGEVSNGSQPDSIETLRRRYLENPSNKSSDFERIIEYLHGQRSIQQDEQEKRSLDFSEAPRSESQTAAADYKLRIKTGQLRPPPTSWLAAGTTFTGHQQATPLRTSSNTLYRLANNQSISSPTLDPPTSRPSNLDSSQPWLAQHLTSTPLSFHSTPNIPGTPSSGPPPDRWTVKVAIHAVDYESMTLKGTMEAFNVPSVTPYSPPIPSSNSTSPTPNHPTSSSPNSQHHTQASSTNKTTFSTYLEGEIIDFSNHTLLTEPDNFAVKTTPTVDALYWRRLEPFAKLSDSEIARALLDRDWVEEQLKGRYVLMRWKERCFVKPTFTSFSNLSPCPRSPPPSYSHPPSADSHPASASATTPAPTRQRHRHRNSHAQQAIDERMGAEQQTYRPTPPPPQQSATTSFLSGADGNGYGLSISGFYYVSLRRSDGRCEGLYYDPQSSPYQHLELKPTEGTWGSGAWEFR